MTKVNAKTILFVINLQLNFPGIISCQLLDGQVDVAEQQLEFLKEVKISFP